MATRKSVETVSGSGEYSYHASQWMSKVLTVYVGYGILAAFLSSVFGVAGILLSFLLGFLVVIYGVRILFREIDTLILKRIHEFKDI